MTRMATVNNCNLERSQNSRYTLTGRMRCVSEVVVGHAAQAPPQSVPASFPFCTPSVHDARAPGRNMHALPTRTWFWLHLLHVEPE